MSKLDDLRLKVIEAEQNLVAEWPSKGPSICRLLQDSRGTEWRILGCEATTVDQVRFVTDLVESWRNLADAEVEALVAHRASVLKNNQKVGS